MRQSSRNATLRFHVTINLQYVYIYNIQTPPMPSAQITWSMRMKQHPEIMLMYVVYLADVVITIIAMFEEAEIYKNVYSEHAQGISYYNHHISRIIYWIYAVGLLSGLAAGFYFGVIAEWNTNYNQTIRNGDTVTHCKERTRMVYLDAWGWAKLLAILVAALGYLAIPYLMAMAQVHVWTIAQVVYDKTVTDKVNLVSRLTYAVFALRVFEMALGHAWAVARTDCLTKLEGNTTASHTPKKKQTENLLSRV